jgi:methionyl-tRNA formyltransferase
MNVFISMNTFGHAMLEELLSRGVPISKIYTIHPDRAGKISDYKDFRPIAKRKRIPLAHVTHIRAVKEDIRRLAPPHIFVFGWSQLLDDDFLSLATHGVLGSHPAVLPKNRGRAVIPWHIINNETKGGITFFYIDSGTDSGPIVGQRTFPIGPKMTATDYYERIIGLGRNIVATLAPILSRGAKVPAKKQNHTKATYLSKRTFEDGKIDWNNSAVEIEKLIRALTAPYPGAWTLCMGQTLIIDQAEVKVAKKSDIPGTVVGRTKRGMVVQTGKELLEITRLREGKIPLALIPGTILG